VLFGLDNLSLGYSVKNLIKLQHGEYIAIEHLESIYKSCQLVSNICVYASAEAKQPIAIIVPHKQNLRQALSSMDSAAAAPSPAMSLSDLCKEKKVKSMILEECNTLGKHSGLRAVELLFDVILTAEEWTAENGLLTAAQKLQRSKIANAFKDQIDVSFFNFFLGFMC
jgi:long-chain acyl-CoA synthetase